jgi:hypothetical protein
MTEAKNFIIDIESDGEMTASLDHSSRWGESGVDPLRDVQKLIDETMGSTGSDMTGRVLVVGQGSGQLAMYALGAMLAEGIYTCPLVDEGFQSDFGLTEERLLDLYGLSDLRHTPIDNLYKTGSARQQSKHDDLKTLFARYGGSPITRARAERYTETRNRFHMPVAAPKNIEDFITERPPTKRQRRRQKGKNK